VFGHCSAVCNANSDCPQGASCASIPRLRGDSAPLFYGCLPSNGVLTTEMEVHGVSDRLRIPVPSSAQSFTLVMSNNDEKHAPTVLELTSPSGQTLYRPVAFAENANDNPVRYTSQVGVSTMMVPNNDQLDLEVGVYTADIAALLPDFGNGLGVEVPTAKVLYKLDTSRILDLHFYFLNLEDHPCSGALEETLNASSASTMTSFQKEYLEMLRDILADAGLKHGITTFTDIQRPDLDAVDRISMRKLLRLSDRDTGISIFFVRSLSPDGIQAIPGGVPGPPRTSGTSASGIVVSLDTACFRPWETLARVTAHTIGAQMGLFYNRDQDGIPDPITDTDASAENLMFFSEFGGVEVSDGQRSVLGRYPGLR
jgi:hypothetical protein